ncbi:hypothetical protein JR316_0000486 [Psilocybe cubensis]|uniref:Uncharacterized protein n=1 Tax=Psilocybe cubensis TaxID=181762 RepID=A0ACB8HFD8_PSICU|nr:hypothetical protein JR316_0000486 [Psilocybe cubensis]KAH9486422.1 hypothetical protein JR316_0000486 [Psilocybe cubensis]
MPRPRPLTSTASYRGSDQQLTPRTPHSGSRTSRLEQGFSKIPLSESNGTDYDDDSGALQSAPLLASSSTARFSVHSARARATADSNGKGGEARKPLHHPMQFLYRFVSRLPLAVGIFLSGILLFLIVVSFTRPEALHKYVGAKAPTSSASSSAPIATSALNSKFSPSHSHKPTIPGAHTISYANYTTFPLHPNEYLNECAKLHQGYMSHGDFWDIGPMGGMDVPHDDDIKSAGKVCSSTITYMLDGTVGLSADLALMAQAAALANERNRTFFVDDTYWNRGKWLDHFEELSKGQPGPEPNCLPPPADELVACPRTSRHWVINARTAKFHFGHAFSDHYEDPYGHSLNRLKPIFDYSGHSLKSVIIPNEWNTKLIRLARKELSAFIQEANEQDNSGIVYIATHIRRGDRKSLSYIFPDRKIPLEDYSNAVATTWTRLHPGSASSNPVVYLATDSPTAYEQFSQLYRGRFYSLFDASDPRLRPLASPGEYFQKTFNELDIHERITATRGMIVDLAIVSGLWPAEGADIKPDAVVCAISSSVCRLSAVGLGWVNAFGNLDSTGGIDNTNKRWVDVDQKGIVEPIWEAFELF